MTTAIATIPTTTAPAAKTAPRRRKPLRGLSDIRRFFHRNASPVYFVSATNFNLLGIDEWVGNFSYINYIDSFDGRHPAVFVPPEVEHEPFESIEDINNYLLAHRDVGEMVRARAAACPKGVLRKGSNGRVVFLMFDERTEALAKKLGLEVCFPKARLRNLVDDKIEATRIAARAGVPCVPNALARVGSYDDLRKASKRLGEHLVVQTAFGDSGHTTYFISDKADYDKHKEDIEAAPEVKIMRRINCRQSALEACVTRHGVIVGPLMTELVGFKELTPYKGGWCGNEVLAAAFDGRVRNRARRAVQKFGEELKKMGYRGYFEVDFLTDMDTGKIYLGEVNPRITGVSSMTNLASFAHADAPLFLFHLLEWMNVDYEFDVDELNARWSNPDNIDTWAQLVIKHTQDKVERATAAPRSGIWNMEKNGSVFFHHEQTHRRTVRNENQAFYFRIAGKDDWLYEGADLGILVSRGRFMNNDFTLSDRAKSWIRGIRGQYEAKPLGARAPMPEEAAIGAFKLS